ncbi:MAG: hypothetical protein AAF465_07750 [Pseudomonadota bacterium]
MKLSVRLREVFDPIEISSSELPADFPTFEPKQVESIHIYDRSQGDAFTLSGVEFNQVDAKEGEIRIGFLVPPVSPRSPSEWGRGQPVLLKIEGHQIVYDVSHVEWRLRNSEPLIGELGKTAKAGNKARVNIRSLPFDDSGLFNPKVKLKQPLLNRRTHRVSVQLREKSGRLVLMVMPLVGEGWEIKVSGTTLTGWESFKSKKEAREKDHGVPLLLGLTIGHERWTYGICRLPGQSSNVEATQQWNERVLSGMTGRFITEHGRPWNPLPKLPEPTSTTRPIIVSNGVTSSRQSLFWFGLRSQTTKIRYDWRLAEHSTKPEPLTFDYKPPDWNVGGGLETSPFAGVDTVFAETVVRHSFDDADGAKKTLEMNYGSLGVENTDEKYVEFDGMEFDFSEVSGAKVRCEIDGWEKTRVSGWLLNSDLTAPGTRGRYSAAGGRGERFSTLTSGGDEEAQIVRPSIPSIGVLEGSGDSGAEQEASLEGDFALTTRSSKGGNQLVQAELRTKIKNKELPAAFYFQHKPFLLTLIKGQKHDPEGGSTVARWRNDDTDQPQWRSPYRSVSIALPAQAIGEEMERGNRFWKDGIPYMKEEAPIHFRFSPSTELELRPDRGKQRYKPLPTNLRWVVDDADVMSFRTEMAYPVAVKFERDAQELPDLRLRESSTFFGSTVQLLPENASDVFERTLEGELLIDWAATKNIKGYDEFRVADVASAANFNARISRLHLTNPQGQTKGLNLRQGLSMEIRSHGLNKGIDGATPPLMSPLPEDQDDLRPIEKQEIESFLIDTQPDEGTGDEDKETKATPDWGDESNGAFRGGVLHTIEFKSELLAVLRKPSSTHGSIDELSFSNLGASGNGTFEFDNKKTKFSVEVRDGQIARLLKIRIGRIGIVWNRAYHIVVYERTVVPSAQFEDQQRDHDHLGRPVLRKTEEYIEPIDVTRPFDKEKSKDKNNSVGIDGFEVVSPRIYVDSAWGTDLDGEGYTIPLWDGGRSERTEEERKGGWYYPKPKLAFYGLNSTGSTCRNTCRNPDELVFYTSTVDTSSNPSDWDARKGVDAAAGLCLLGVITPILEVPAEVNDFIQNPATVRPRPDAIRRPGFDLLVDADGAIDIQKGRTNKPVYAKLDLISMARTAESGGLSRKDLSKIQDIGNVEAKLKEVRNAANAGTQISNATRRLREWIDNLPENVLRYQCEDLERKLLEELDSLEIAAKREIIGVFTNLKDNLPVIPDEEEVKATIWEDLVGRHLTDGSLLTEYAKDALNYIDSEILVKPGNELANLEGEARETLFGKLRSACDGYSSSLTRAIRKLKTGILEDLTSASAELSGALDDLDVFASELHAFYEEAKAGNAWANEKAKEARRSLNKADRLLASKSANGFESLIDRLRKFLAMLDSLLAVAETVNVEDLKSVLDGAIGEGLSNLKSTLESIKKAIDEVRTTIEDKAKSAIEDIVRKRSNFEKLLKDELQEKNESRQAIEMVRQELSGAGNSIIEDLRVLETEKLGELREATHSLVVSVYKDARGALDVYAAFGEAVEKNGAFWTSEVEEFATEARKFIQENAAKLCDNIEELEDEINDRLRAAEKKLRRKAGDAAKELFDEETREALKAFDKETKQHIKKIREELDNNETIGKVDSAIKLGKAIGDLPKLPTLSFNVDRAEYVFDDIKTQLETSQFASKFKEIDAGLKELGVSLPSIEIGEEMIPQPIRDLDFNKVIDSVGGMDFSKFLERFRLPELRSDQYKITHDIDKASRSAWVKAEINLEEKKRQELFGEGGLTVFTEKMHAKALTEVRVFANGEKKTTTDGEYKADWALNFGGADLVMFREVTVRYDGNSFDFDIDPNKIEYHPSFKFISDLAQTLEESLPPWLELIKDGRGLPIGARAKMDLKIDSPPPLGPITLGPLHLLGGLEMRLANHGEFVLQTVAGVGTEETPIMVSIGWLGGGAWITCQATRAGSGEITYHANFGVGLGDTKAINLASVARGSYTYLLYASAIFDDKTGGLLRAGLTIQGSARILGIANAYVFLGLSVTHKDGGGTTGQGTLRVKIKMSKFYTLRVNKGVTNNF